MGCVSSKHIKKDLQNEETNNKSKYTHHVVSLTSSTYGALKLDNNNNNNNNNNNKDHHQPPPEKNHSPEKKVSPPRRSHHGPPEIINAWELMEDLEDSGPAVSGPGKRSPKLRRGFGEIEVKTPMKVVNQIGTSPKVSKRFSGKENKKVGPGKAEFSPKVVIANVKASTLPPNLRISKKSGSGSDSPGESGSYTARRKNLGPLFDPESKVKKSQNSRNSVESNAIESNAIMAGFEKKWPPGGENVVVIYTTTLRGIRKTFEDCNIVRGIIESHHVRVIERDVSMDSGFKEELRLLLGKKEVKVPVVLVKGRLIGGSEEIMKLEEEGKLGILLEGIPTVAGAGCKGCGGVRFVMCTVCNGSCKLIGGDGRRSIKCLECNENGLVQCPFCC